MTKDPADISSGVSLPPLKWLRDAKVENGRTSAASLLEHSTDAQAWMSYRDREKSTAHELFEEAALRVFDTRQANESTKFDQHVTSFREGGWDLRQAAIAHAEAKIIQSLGVSDNVKQNLTELLSSEGQSNLYLEDDEAWPDATEWRKAAAVALGDDPGLDDFVSVDDLGQRFQTAMEKRSVHFREALGRVPEDFRRKPNLPTSQASVVPPSTARCSLKVHN